MKRRDHGIQPSDCSLPHISINDIDGGGICVIMGGGSSGFLPLCMLSALGSELAVFARCHARHGLEHA